jgi:hypothetical protein
MIIFNTLTTIRRREGHPLDHVPIVLREVKGRRDVMGRRDVRVGVIWRSRRCYYSGGESILERSHLSNELTDGRGAGHPHFPRILREAKGLRDVVRRQTYSIKEESQPSPPPVRCYHIPFLEELIS